MATIRCSRGSRVRLEYGFEQHQGEIDVAGRSPAQLSPIANGRASGDNDWRQEAPAQTGDKKRLRRLERTRERKKLTQEQRNRGIAQENRYRKQQDEAPLATLAKSKNQEATERQITSLHARARRRRKDFTEQVSTSLARNYRLSVFEDLHTKSMTASAKGTIKTPGRNVTQKAGLNRASLNKGWYAPEHRTGEKQLRHGHSHVVVPAAGTSITCVDCAHVDKDSRVSQSMFACTTCGYEANADLNAADEILERGTKLALAAVTPATAHQGANLGPASAGAEPGSVSAGRGSGNEETDTSTVEGAA